MTFSRDRRSPGVPRWTLAVLAACILANIAIDLVLATVEYRSLEEFYPTRNLSVVDVLGSSATVCGSRWGRDGCGP